MESMFQAKEDQSKQPQTQPNATPAPAPAAASTPAPAAPAAGSMDAMFSQKEKAENPPASTTGATPQASANDDNSDAAKELARKQGAAKHGILARAWDWINEPILDNVLPEGVKTADIIKGAAFEKMYNEAYIPGVNDFNTKAATQFEPAEKMAAGLGPKEKDGAIKKHIRQFLIDHASSIDATANATNTFVAGATRDTADMGAGFTSPLSLGTLGLGKAGRVGKVLGPLVGTAFGLQGLGQGAEAAQKLARTTTWENLKHGYLDPDAVQQLLGGTGQAALAGASTLHTVGEGVKALGEKARPTMETVGGQPVPVRAKGTIAEAIQKGVSPEVNEAATAKTQAAVQQGVGNVVGEGVGSKASTKIAGQDRLGIRAHAADLKEAATDAMDELNRLSNGDYEDAKSMMEKSKRDFTTKGREDFNTAQGLHDDIIEQHREAMANAGYDVDEMKANYRKAIALEKIASRMDTATGPLEGGTGYEVKGERLAKVIDDMRRVPGNENPSLSKNLFERAGLTEDHINALADLADTLRDQQEIPKFGSLTKLAAKAISIAATTHVVGAAGLSGLFEGLAGEKAGEIVGSKVMTKLFGDALTSEPLAKELNQKLKGGVAALSTWDKFHQAVKDAYSKVKAIDLGGEEGAVGANVQRRNVGEPSQGKFARGVKPISETPNEKMEVKPRENGDWEFNHPNGTSQMVLHPEPDTRPGYEGKTQLRQTGISAVDAPGAGQEMMDDAVARMKNLDSVSRIVSDHPDLRSPENEGHWAKLARRGHNVETEAAPDSDGKPYTNDAGEDGRVYSIANEDNGASQVAAHEEKGGSTFDSKGRNLDGSDKYTVATHPERTQMVDGKLTPERLRHFKTLNADLLNQEGYGIGTWDDPDSGKTTLDIVKLFDDREDAVKAGKGANQKAIYHLGGEGEIPTGGTGKVPGSISDAAARYNKSVGKNPEIDNTKVGIDPRANAVADAYDALKHNPNDPKVKAAYNALINETKAQWQALKDAGYRMEPTAQDPYTGYEQMRDDVTKNKRIKVWLGGEPPADHPLSGVDPETGLSYNTMFRAVHDIMGHVAGDNDFSQTGEENAYQRHAQSYSKDALPALTTETKGQTSNFFNSSKVRAGATPDFAEQKAALLPDKFNGPQQAETNEGSEIATRRPTTKKSEATNAPGQYADMAGVEAASKANPGGGGKLGYADKLARTISKYSGIEFSEEDLQSPQKVMEKFINHLTDNLVSLHDAMPEPMRKIARQWYDTANTMAKQMAEKHGVTPEQSAGVLAALSPQNAWDNNVALADRLMDTYKNRQNFEYSPKMEAQAAKIKQGQLSRAAQGILKDIHGKTLTEIDAQQMPERFAKKWGDEADQKWANVKKVQQAMWIRLYDEAHNSPQNPMFHPNGDVVGMSPSNRSWIGLDHLAKSLRILDNGSVDNINAVMGDGNKIRNFYNNIINPDSPNGHTTIDTHAVGAAQFQPFSGDDAEVQHNFGNSPKGIAGAPKHAGTGMRGTYPLYAEAYRRAAAKLGLQPRELQSITWEGIRSLMGDEKKTPELKAFAREQWEKVQNKELTPQQARDTIIEKAGGFSKPSWMTDEQWDEAMGTGFNPEEFNHE